MTTLQDISDALAIAGVYEGFPVERNKLAGHLFNFGTSVADIEMLAKHVDATVDEASGRALASLVASDRDREARLVDLRKIVDLRTSQGRSKARAPGDKPYVPAPQEGEAREVWAHDRKCREAYCLVHSDRKDPKWVASHFGVHLGTINAMVDRGKTLSASSYEPKGRKGEPAKGTAEERIREFRNNMANAPKTVKSKAIPTMAQLSPAIGEILDDIRTKGHVDLRKVMRTKLGQGALATIEYDGLATRNGPVDKDHCQPYLLARDDSEKAHFRALVRGAQPKPRPSVGAIEPPKPNRAD